MVVDGLNNWLLRQMSVPWTFRSERQFNFDDATYTAPGAVLLAGDMAS